MRPWPLHVEESGAFHRDVFATLNTQRQWIARPSVVVDCYSVDFLLDRTGASKGEVQVAVMLLTRAQFFTVYAEGDRAGGDEDPPIRPVGTILLQVDLADLVAARFSQP